MHNFIRAALGIGAGLSIVTSASCDQATSISEDVCGPCGSLVTGDLSISGVAQLDGFFKAVANLRDATASIRTNFDQDILAIAELYGISDAEVDPELVAELRAQIEADIALHTTGGIRVVLEPVRCQADVAISVEAQAACEVQAGCEVEANPGMLSVECEGTCRGECTGTCSGELSCAVTTPTVACEGMCEGSCALEGAAQCDGVCRGDCSGTCSATAANGECAGRCEGMCEGVCEIEGQAECSGTCQGTCFVDPGSAQCTAQAECAGSCDAECSGRCEGAFEPPEVSADCEASADCNAQAQAQAQANLQCTPPQLTIDFALDTDLDADARAAFVARMKELKVRAVGIVQGLARLQALVTGEVEGRVVFEPAPVMSLRFAVEGLIEGVVDGEFAIVPGRLACVVPAFEASITALSEISADAQVTLTAGAEFSALLGR